LRVRTDGSQSFEPVAGFDTTQNKFVALPIDLGPATDQVFLVLFGTGLRFRSSLAAVTAKIGGADATVTFAGAVVDFIGLDQANLALPRSLIGRGEVDVVLMVDGKTANTVANQHQVRQSEEENQMNRLLMVVATLCLLLAQATTGEAATATIRVVDQAGQPVPSAIISYSWTASPPAMQAVEVCKRILKEWLRSHTLVGRRAEVAAC
jgi:hypothetical protein